MADLFTITYDIGAGAHPRTLALLLNDYADLTEAASKLAEIDALRAAESYVRDRLWSDGPRGLRSMAQEREISIRALDRRDELFDWEFMDEEWELFYREFGFRRLPPHMARRISRRLMYGLTSGVPDATGTDSPWSDLASRLVADETQRRSADADLTVRRFAYENPSVTEIVAVGSAASAAIAYLLNTVVTLRARRRSAESRADAEGRINRAAAYDVEDQVRARSELRSLLLDQVARGELRLRPADISDDFVERILVSTDRLGRGDMTFERRELPSAEA